MVTGIIGLLSLVLGFAIWAIKRKTAEQDSPETKHENAISSADSAIAQGPAGIQQVNLQVESAIDHGAGGRGAGPSGPRMPNPASGRDTGGPGDPVRLPGVDELNRRLPGASGPDA
jgi:hypothetical protein